MKRWTVTQVFIRMASFLRLPLTLHFFYLPNLERDKKYCWYRKIYIKWMQSLILKFSSSTNKEYLNSSVFIKVQMSIHAGELKNAMMKCIFKIIPVTRTGRLRDFFLVLSAFLDDLLTSRRERWLYMIVEFWYFFQVDHLEHKWTVSISSLCICTESDIVRKICTHLTAIVDSGVTHK